jgi:hypothetical protein
MTAGVPVTSNNNNYPSSVMLGSCSATKISTNKYLLAAHCISATFFSEKKTIKIKYHIVNKLNELELINKIVNVEKIFTQDGVTPEVVISSETTILDDIAIIELKENLNSIPIVKLKHTDSLAIKDKVNFTCFGKNELGYNQPRYVKNSYLPRQGFQHIDKIEKESFVVRKTKKNKNTFLGSDSGCGIYDESIELVGILISGGYNRFNFWRGKDDYTHNVILRLSNHEEWISEVMYETANYYKIIERGWEQYTLVNSNGVMINNN